MIPGMEIGKLLSKRELVLPLSEVFGPTFQGEGPHTGRPAVFVRLGHCNLACNWCMAPGALVLRPDFTYTPVEQLKVGDKVLGRTTAEQGKHGQLVEATVTNTFRRQAPLQRVNGSLTCAAETRFWVSRNRNARSGWREIERCEGLNCTFLAEPMKRDQHSYELGYLAGVADGDGCFWDLRTRGKRPYRRFRLAINDRNILDRFREFAANHGFTLRPGSHSYSGHVDGRDSMECLWLTESAEAERFEEAIDHTPDGESWRWGYLAGIFDAEGSLASGHIVRISQHSDVNGPTYKRIAETARMLGFDVVEENRGIRLRTAGGELWRFLVGATPIKRSVLDKAVGRAPNNARTIHAVEDAGHGEVVSLTTSTGNYIAEGWLVHNCDTPYTWDATRYDLATENPDTPVEQIVEDATSRGASLFIMSGGEPLMHQRKPAMHTLVSRLAERGAVHIETNGTIPPTPWARDLVAHFSVSPKLSNNGADPAKRRIKPRAIAEFADLAAKGRACFKFVATCPEDLNEVDNLVDENRVPASAVWIMPEGTTSDQVLGTHRDIADAVLQRGYNTTTRLHTLLWEQERAR